MSKDTNEAPIPLGERMKIYEKQYEHQIPVTSHFIVRLDGKCFSQFTKGLHVKLAEGQRKPLLPFDPLFQRVMTHTMVDLMQKFQARTGYCHSDEITLVFAGYPTERKEPNDTTERTHMFNGRVEKILTLTASFCSVRFNYWFNSLMEPIKDQYPETVWDRVSRCEQIFDARVLEIPYALESEIVNHFVWRSVYDCRRNCISTYARHFMGHKAVMHMKSDELVMAMKNKHQYEWNEQTPMWLKYGVYAKHEQRDFTTIDLHSGESITTKRCHVVCRCFRIKFHSDLVNLFLAKYWSDEGEKETGQEITQRVNGSIDTLVSCGNDYDKTIVYQFNFSK